MIDLNEIYTSYLKRNELNATFKLLYKIYDKEEFRTIIARAVHIGLMNAYEKLYDSGELLDKRIVNGRSYARVDDLLEQHGGREYLYEMAVKKLKGYQLEEALSLLEEK